MCEGTDRPRPQDGGGHLAGHRCAGELVTVELVKAAVRFLVGSLRYRVPPQDLDVNLSRMPATPRSRFVITDVALVERAPRIGGNT